MNSLAAAVMDRAVLNIFETETKRCQKLVDTLIDENDRLIGCWSVGFNYKGVDYGREGSIVSSRRSTPLSAFLIPKMVEVAQTQQSINFDRSLVVQSFRKLFEPLETILEMRDALPECVTAMDPVFTGLPRTREPGWNLAGNPRDHRQYLKVVTKIEMYCTLRFVY